MPVKNPTEINEKNILLEVQKTLNERLNALQKNQSTAELKPGQSYVEQLYREGLNKMGKKVIEEAGEILMAAKDCEHKGDAPSQQELVNEITDLWFHCMVLLTYYGGDVTQVLTEATKRFGTSGLAEKNARSK
jgi:phosphoribosyl-ATP pyrophosphohydrolase